jgi:hypothetical protein
MQRSLHIAVKDLAREAQLFHLQFFRSPAPQSLIDGYLKFHAEAPTLVQALPHELRTVAMIVEKRLDAIGIEPWLRRGATRHLLSRKLLLIAYLAECDPTYSCLRQAVVGRQHSLVQLFVSAVAGGGRLLKGRIQKAVHGLL